MFSLVFISSSVTIDCFVLLAESFGRFFSFFARRITVPAFQQISLVVFKKELSTAAIVAVARVQSYVGSIMALRRLWGVFRRPTPQPVFPLTVLRDRIGHVFMLILEYIGIEGVPALARTDKRTYQCVVLILRREKMRFWNIRSRMDEERGRMCLLFGKVTGRTYQTLYCLCRNGCKEKPSRHDFLKSAFPMVIRMRHDLRLNDRIALVSSDNLLVIYRVTSYSSRRCCGAFPLGLCYVMRIDFGPGVAWTGANVSVW